jgi:hypothetical protein
MLSLDIASAPAPAPALTHPDDRLVCNKYLGCGIPLTIVGLVIFSIGIQAALLYERCNIFTCKNNNDMVACYATQSNGWDCDMTPIKYDSCEDFRQLVYGEFKCVKPTPVNTTTLFYKPREGMREDSIDGISGGDTFSIAFLGIVFGIIGTFGGLTLWFNYKNKHKCKICIRAGNA